MNIVKLFQFFELPKSFCLIIEYVNGGDLFDAIREAVSFHFNPSVPGLSKTVSKKTEFNKLELFWFNSYAGGWDIAHVGAWSLWRPLSLNLLTDANFIKKKQIFDILGS